MGGPPFFFTGGDFGVYGANANGETGKEAKTPGAQGMQPFWTDTTVISNARNAHRPE